MLRRVCNITSNDSKDIDFRTANQSWPLVLNDLDWFIEHGDGKKMYFDEVSYGFTQSRSNADLVLQERVAISNVP